MPFTHILHPEITKIKQVNVNGVRYYDTPDGTLISITSLLKNFTPEGILEWRKSVGEEAANEVMKAATARGSKVHKIIESCLSNEPENGDLITNGGRVLGVSALGHDIQTAVERAYQSVSNINFDRAHYRTDIAHRAIERVK